MTIPRGTSLLHSVFIPIFADDWKQLSIVAIAYFPLSEWWMWSYLSYCAEVPNSVDNEGLSICAMDRAHQKGWIKASRKAIITTGLFPLLFMMEWFLKHGTFLAACVYWRPNITLHLAWYAHQCNLCLNGMFSAWSVLWSMRCVD